MERTLVLLSLSFALTQGLGTYNWAQVTKLKENVEFDCLLWDSQNGTNTAVKPTNTSTISACKWQLPGGRILNNGSEEGNKRVNGTRLIITGVTLEDKGVYLCHAELECGSTYCERTDMWYKHGLNLNGPRYDNPMEKYRMNFIVGAASAGGVLALFLLACLIYKFRYKSHDKDDISMDSLSQYQGKKISDAAGVEVYRPTTSTNM